ncbi:hypothetical protein [Saccharopolyspora oryzae]|uniref:Lipoprotein n=1 Tax=Saccharopolyspora oryzae TaxID=2997343 RepID=A0ABT4UTE4_9PSEU|nr:hypothetical protein [Saccharopolyspora oryzae]MDA3624981.1 hypothetical protein [Saccharopolyspora oryzae]
MMFSPLERPLMDRRSFVSAAALAAASMPLLEAAPANASPSNDRALQRIMLDALTRELDDAATAAAVEPAVEDIGFNWHPPVAPIASLDYVVAYSFGNRPPAGGGDPSRVRYEPGPVNEALADAVAKVRAARDIPVFAQWEIAHFLETKYSMDRVTSVEPVVQPDGTIVYLSTDGVAEQVVAFRGGTSGTAGVVGFRDHVKRCVLTTRDRGMTAFAPEGVTMPGTYDELSGQPWTRRRDLYLLHDMYAQFARWRAHAITAAYPNG